MADPLSLGDSNLLPAFAELSQFEMNLAPLNFRDTHLLPDLIGLHSRLEIAQDASPTAHVE
jgi:hypothetical protein